MSVYLFSLALAHIHMKTCTVKNVECTALQNVHFTRVHGSGVRCTLRTIQLYMANIKLLGYIYRIAQEMWRKV